jgi:hypothetical protein
VTAHLEAAAAEIESFVGKAGWDSPPALFALVRTGELASDEPAAVARLGLRASTADALTPIEQEGLPAGDLDQVLGAIAWPDGVAGCALSQHIVLLPPSAEADLSVDAADISIDAALTHPRRREARLVAAVLRDGSSAVLLRLRNQDGSAADDDLLTGPDLAPNLVRALLATFE